MEFRVHKDIDSPGSALLGDVAAAIARHLGVSGNKHPAIKRLRGSYPDTFRLRFKGKQRALFSCSTDADGMKV